MTVPAIPADPLFLAFQSAIAGRYSLDRELGRGGMGIVYLARDLALDRPVAIKLLPPTLSALADLRARFLAEARTAARLSHPNIVPIFAVEETGEFVYFVMAFIAGGTLGDQLRRRGSLPPPNTARIVRDVAWALDYAHGMGIIHRDVKPDNILMEEGNTRVLVADFGIAARVEAAGMGDGTVSGTTGFMSPEQAAGASIDGRSDLYSLGVVGALTLTGRMPDAGTPLTRIAPQAPRAIVQVIDRCLEVDRSHRYTNGREIADALDRAGGGELPAPLRIWLSRGRELHMPMAIWSVLVSIPALVGMAFSSYHYYPELLLPLLIASLPWMGYGAWRIYQARLLLGAGYGLHDLQYALQVYSAQRSEELSFQFGKGPTKLGRALRFLAYTGLITCGLAGIAIARNPAIIWIQTLFEVAGWVGAGSAVLGMAIPGRDMSRDRALERRQRFWQGRAGQWMLKVASIFQRPVAAPERALQRPTELALGHAAEALFAALPPAARQDLNGLPETIARLSAQAAEYRKKWQEMEGLRVDVRTNEIEAGAALEQARVIWKERFDETVAALESLRLGLLRLHNGAGSVSGLATDLANARTMINRLRELGAAQAEVEAISPET
ncbi:MAG TPA: protein kinase, partial [Gemmatimonadales bacterium]|nr:protein kinase [Gemmatimonadales bacterium]